MEERGWFHGQDHAHLKIAWIRHQTTQKDTILTYPPPAMPDFHKEPNHSSGSKISPAVLFIIVILAVLFFISGILHLLVWFLSKNPSSSRPGHGPEAPTPDQRQLQQLFHLQDSGLDQTFIDALPVFSYKEMASPKEPFDCAVCLCEFTESDQLKLLPACSHAFHINCIDTWLHSNSTCPLCRGALFNPGFSMENPIFDYDGFREEVEVEIVEAVEKGVYPVRLGKFRKLNKSESGGDIGEKSSSKLDERRCYSMGSYQYMVAGDANLRVALNHDQAKFRNWSTEGEKDRDRHKGG